MYIKLFEISHKFNHNYTSNTFNVIQLKKVFMRDKNKMNLA